MILEISLDIMLGFCYIMRFLCLKDEDFVVLSLFV